MNIDDDFIDEGLAGAFEREASVSAQVWREISHDLRTGGPLAALALDFREMAVEAVKDLIAADADKPNEIRRYQDQIKRFLTTVQLIHHHRANAVDLDASLDAQRELTETESSFISSLERGTYSND